MILGTHEPFVKAQSPRGEPKRDDSPMNCARDSVAPHVRRGDRIAGQRYGLRTPPANVESKKVQRGRSPAGELPPLSEHLEFPAKFLGILFQTGRTEAGKNINKAGSQRLPVDSPGMKQCEHIGEIYFGAAFDLAERRAIEVEVENVKLTISPDELRALSISLGERDASSTLIANSSFKWRTARMKAA